jgi:hypothetical protein
MIIWGLNFIGNCGHGIETPSIRNYRHGIETLWSMYSELSVELLRSLIPATMDIDIEDVEVGEKIQRDGVQA